MTHEERKALLADLGGLMAGLQVPISLNMPLGRARECWVRITEHTPVPFGWRGAEEFTAALGKALGVCPHCGGPTLGAEACVCESKAEVAT